MPAESAVLNYRLIGFTFAEEPRAVKYTLEIALGDFRTEDSFKKNIIITLDDKATKIIAETPAFGAKYTWRTIAYGKKNNAVLTTSPLHHFSVGMTAWVDSAKMRVRVLSPAEEYADAHFFLDGNKALFGMDGKPVWYLPDVDGLITSNADVNDLKVTPQGTITFIVNDKFIYEISYSGDVLWKGPANGSIDDNLHYHNEFTRLNNGHYMAFITEPVLMKHDLAVQPDSGYVIVPDNIIRDTLHTEYETFPLTDIVEYDEKGNVVWLWKSADYLATSDIYYRLPPIRKNRYDLHPNSFYFDEKNKMVYLSLRNINRILKIRYPDGAVVRTYGHKFKRTQNTLPASEFAGQHCIRMAEDGDLYLYNNGQNDGSAPTTSQILKLREPASDRDSLVKTWEYDCTIDDANHLKHKVFGNTWGGTVTELPDHSFFVSMSSEYAKIFIVNPKKEVLFAALPERWDAGAKKWRIMNEFHGTVIESHEKLERLIFNGH